METENNLVRDFAQEEVKKKKFNFKLFLVVFLLAAAGVGTGYFLSFKQTEETVPLGRDVKEEEVTKGTIVGITDEETFSDSAEGKLKKGGLDGEGSHHLVRPGGESQNVYLTSSIVDLDKFVDRQVKVWGETFAGQKAGWLMDVGKVRVLE